MEKRIILICVIILVFVLVYTNHELNQKEGKIKFLENQLATKSLHYEWLEEITNSLLGENTEEFVKEFNEFKKYRNANPKT